MKRWFIVTIITIVVLVIIAVIVVNNRAKVRGTTFLSLSNHMTNQDPVANAGGGSDTSAKNLSACSGNALFDHTPIDVSALSGGIEPLGHMAGSHILPSEGDHIYLHTTSDPTILADDDPVATVYAPGNITLLQVVKQKREIQGAKPNEVDYMLVFSPCRSVMFGFIHIKTLSQKIEAALASHQPHCLGGDLDNCTYANLSVSFSSGEIMGTAPGWDFGGADVRTPSLGFINQNAQMGMLGDSYLHAICPLDYFTDDVKNELYSKLLTQNPGANGIPACGTTMQDKMGTIQGNWYETGNSTTGGLNETKVLAFGHDNLDPSQGIVSAGTDLVPSQSGGAQIIFKPEAGLINHEPSNVTSDDKVYCYEGASNGVNGHIDIQLVSATELKADYASGGCSDIPALEKNAVTYVR